MNKIFKVVFNKVKGMVVVCSELSKSHGKSKHRKTSVTTVENRPARFTARLTKLALVLGLGFACAMPNAYADKTVNSDETKDLSSSDNAYTYSGEGTLTITKEGELIVTGENSIITNNGTAEIIIQKDEDDDWGSEGALYVEDDDGSTLVNNGTLKITNNGALEVINSGSTLTNNGKLTTSGERYIQISNLKNTKTLESGTALWLIDEDDNYGFLTNEDSDAEFTNNAYLEAGEINNNGAFENNDQINIIKSYSRRGVSTMGTLTNSGDGAKFTNNNGAALIAGEIDNSAEFENAGYILLTEKLDASDEPIAGGGTLTNTGTFNNVNSDNDDGYLEAAALTNNGTFDNSSSIVLAKTYEDEDITALGDLTNSGSTAEFTNSGLLYTGTLANSDSATFTNSGAISTTMSYEYDATYDSSTDSYAPSVTDDDGNIVYTTIQNGTFTNSGTVTNDGTITIVQKIEYEDGNEDDGVLTYGTFTNEASSSFTNNGNFMAGTLTNESGAEVTNTDDGVIYLTEKLENKGTLTNSCILGTPEIINSGDLTITDDGAISTTITYGDEEADGSTGSITNTGTITTSGYLETGTLTNSNTLNITGGTVNAGTVTTLTDDAATNIDGGTLIMDNTSSLGNVQVGTKGTTFNLNDTTATSGSNLKIKMTTLTSAGTTPSPPHPLKTVRCKSKPSMVTAASTSTLTDRRQSAHRRHYQ